MLLRFIMLVFILIFNLNGYTQTEINRAKKEMSLFNYSRAAEILQQGFSKSGGKPNCKITLLLADCYRMLNDVSNAKNWYARAFAQADRCRCQEYSDPVIYFNFAQALRSSGEYLPAKKLFLQYDSLTAGKSHGELFASYCDSALAWQSKKTEFVIRNVSALNSRESDFGITFFQHGIIFTSDRVFSKDACKTYGWTGNNYLNLYYSELVAPDSIFGDYKTPYPFRDLPAREWHEGPLTFNPEFTLVFMNQTQLTHDKGKKDPGRIRTHLLKIFSSTLKDGKWTVPEPFFLNSDDYSVGHPSLTKDGQTLFFVSDMPGGYGETDIWFCRLGASGWSNPVNLGPSVNTSGKEMFPYIATNGDLYFASDGLPGYGGLDLFVTRKTDDRWTVPHNLGYPLNSSYDDLSLVVSDHGDFGLFSSNRPGGAGSDDIYFFSKVPLINQKPEDSIKTSPVAPVSAAQISALTPLPDTLKINKSYRLENIFYDFDKWNIRADATSPLENLISIMKEYPVFIELGSHTDCRGTEAYNLILSQKRAESAVQYIISRGISPSRIVARGYGKSQLLNKCNCEAGSECTEAEHQFNRRTEFRITRVGEN